MRVITSLVLLFVGVLPVAPNADAAIRAPENCGWMYDFWIDNPWPQSNTYWHAGNCYPNGIAVTEYPNEANWHGIANDGYNSGWPDHGACGT